MFRPTDVYIPASAPVTPTRLYQPPGPIRSGGSNHASTSYLPYPSQAPSPIIPQSQYASPRLPRPYYSAIPSRMDPAYPSHGASPQTDYATPTTPQLNQSYSQPGSVGSNAPQRTYMSPAAPAPAQAPPSYDLPAAPPPPPLETTPAPTPAPAFSSDQISVHETTVMQGSPGGEFTVKCELCFPPSPAESPSQSADGAPARDRAVRIVFGQHPLPTTVTQIQDPLTSGQMVHLKVQVPGWSLVATAASGNRVPVSIQVLLGGVEIVGSVALGDYSYLSFSSGSRVPNYGGYTSAPSVNPLKRSGDPLESHRSAPPGPNGYIHRRMMSTGFKYDSTSPDVAGHVPLPSYGTPSMQSEYGSPHHAAWVPTGPGPSMYVAPENPPLQRSSQVPSAPVSPYPTPTHLPGGKASLELVGDLNNMAKGWTTDEWNNRRRLVQFWRKQDGTQITAAFQGIPQDKYSAHTQSIIISCIFREDNNLCYVTSVDAIYLLEALVGNRFTVEEKNRIRRNLEGFRPLTVSKSKPGSEDFFKLIMGFPNPKPRNIEKDVKVFPWDILGQALKKIIGKYSATYPGAISPALSTHMLPYVGGYPIHPTHAPHPGHPIHPAPLQPSEHMPPPHMHSYESTSTESIPALTTNASTDSAFSAASGMYDSHPDSSSHLSQAHHSHYPAHHLSHSHVETPPHYRSNSEKAMHHQHQRPHHGDYVNISPTHMSSYSGTTAYYPGMGSPGGGPGGYGMPHGGATYMHHPAPGHGEPSHHLPHVHQSIERQPSSNDLRVMYPNLQQ